MNVFSMKTHVVDFLEWFSLVFVRLRLEYVIVL